MDETTMTEIRIVEVNVHITPPPGICTVDGYEASNYSGWHNGQKPGVLLVFDSNESRAAWMKGKP
jgi:hypothetical protein